MEEYEHRFARLSYFDPDIVGTEEAETERVINGLNLDIQGKVLAHASLDYVEAIKVAIFLDNANRRNIRDPNNQQGLSNKRRFAINSSRSKKQSPIRHFDQWHNTWRQFDQRQPL